MPVLFFCCALVFLGDARVDPTQLYRVGMHRIKSSHRVARLRQYDAFACARVRMAECRHTYARNWSGNQS